MVDIETRIIGLIGYPLGHSYSGILHNRAIKNLSLNYLYLLFPVKPDDLGDAVKGIRSLNLRGVNVTIPYKERVISYLDELDLLAQKIGAVNTIVNDNGRLKGYNTDIIGFQRMLEIEGRFQPTGRRALVIGAGGASRSVLTGLCESGVAELCILNRTEKKAAELAENWQNIYSGVRISAGPLRKDFYLPLMDKIDLVVDTTPVGMAPNINEEPVISPAALNDNLLVVDLVYNPAETTLLKAARKKGARTLNGLGMFLYQGFESFKLWTGITPDLDFWKNLCYSFD